MNTVPQSIIDQAIAVAEQWQNRANQLLTQEEKRLQDQMQRLLNHPEDKFLFSRMIDQAFRSGSSLRVADQLRTLIRHHGVPHFLSTMEQAALNLFNGAGNRLASLAVPVMIDQMRKASSRMIIPGESETLQAHLQLRRQQGVRMNINHLGEMVLGETEAARRLATYVKDMENPDITYISIKISTLYSQISSLALDHTVAVLKERLTTLFRAAQQHAVPQADGSRLAKFINLDMEEYRDLSITYAAFLATLDQPEFRDLPAGIVLQAYLPDSFTIQQQLTAWAKNRVAQGGAPIKLRIVKGANMEMEKLESALNNWPLAPYGSKLEVDANYKRMVAYGMRPEHIQAVHLGVASHNLFDLAYAQTLAQANQVTPYFCFEMLEGMADHIRRAMQESDDDMLLYAPVAGKDEFINAIGYLIRRLDENTAPENFLRHAPGLRVGSPAWESLKHGFAAACHLQESVQATPNRIQDRNSEHFSPAISTYSRPAFINEADTDWSLAANRDWALRIVGRWRKEPGYQPEIIPVIVDGMALTENRPQAEVFDPSQKGVLAARHALATKEDARLALSVAAADADGWRALSVHKRHAILAQVAMEIRKNRGDLIGAAAADTGKVFAEADAEVSEAVDFAEFYPYSAALLDARPNLRVQGKGVCLVIAPWNFPIAIPCGGIAAALAAGNTVIFKPASDAVLTGWILCQCFWRAGVSQKTLQFVPGSGPDIGPTLTASPLVDSIILTGGTDTGLRILGHSPSVYLAAETGGKNATIVTDMADRDQAIKNVLHSAFSNCGQKCSATSLLILEKSIYDDLHFRQQLVDAAASIKVGPAWQLENKLAALVREPDGTLLRGLTTLEPGEEWALQPRMAGDNPHIWSPGIKYGVQPGSFTHLAELFGPVLGVMRAESLDEAIGLVNQTGYGLTSGLESLDEREQKIWKAGIKAGNLYINRGTTGAIVLRQPFGGMGKSALGPGLKAGSLEYVTQFMQISEVSPPKVEEIAGDHRLLQLAQEWRIMLAWGKWPQLAGEIEQTCYAITSYLSHMAARYGRELDYFHLRGQDNVLRYLPVKNLVIRLHQDDSLFATLARLAAAIIAGCEPVISQPPDLTNSTTAFLASQEGRRFLQQIPVITEDDAQLAARLPGIGRLRYAAPERVPAEIFAAAAKTGAYIARTPVYMEGRIELLQYLQQQAICHNYHRYGNLGDRAWE